jgi:hypothetical protein
MKKLISILFLSSPFILFGQSTFLDSVNYYFGILLNQERDSINQYNKNNPKFTPLNYVVVETDTTKFVNPWKHLEYCVEESHNYKTFNAHSTTNLENMMFSWSAGDMSSLYRNPKNQAYSLFQGWKNSIGHYKFMIQQTDGDYKYFSSGDYKTFKVMFKISYRSEYTTEEIKHQKKIRWVYVASFTAWE